MMHRTSQFGKIFNCTSTQYLRNILKRKLHNNETAETMAFANMLKNLENQRGSIDLELNNENGIAIVTLNNTEVKNAVDGAMMLDLLEVIQELETWKEGKAVIMKGAEGYFCSGGDLQNFVSILNSRDDGLAMCQFMQDLTTRFSRLPLISVAAIQGGAVGGGAEVTTCCDFRLMSSKASIIFAQKRMGLTTGWGGGARLSKLIGKRKAMELLIGNNPVGFLKAEEIGLVDGPLGNDKDPNASCLEWLERRGFLKGSPHLIQSFKSMAAIADDYSVDIALAHERDMFGRHWGSEEHNRNIEKYLNRSTTRE